MKEWIETNTVTSYPNKIINCVHCTGMGDKIHVTAAIREYKKLNPTHKILVMIDKTPEVFKNNPYVDYVIPGCITNIQYRNGYDIYHYFEWSFYEHHQYDHVVAPYFKYILDDYGIDKYDYSMELYPNYYETIECDKFIQDIRQVNKKIVGISPSYTMYNRMLNKDNWQKIVDILNDQGYIVVSFGDKRDLELNKVIDKRGIFSINTIPYILDRLDHVICVNGGFLNIAACTKEVHILFLNVGEFPSRLFVPVRNKKLGWNCDIIEHECEFKEKCFKGHIEEDILRDQIKSNISKYGKDYELDIIEKYSVWNYCAKEQNKYTCGNLIFDNFVNYIEEGKLEK